MRILKKTLLIILISLFAIIVGIASVTAILYFSADMKQPNIVSASTAIPVAEYKNHRQWGENYLRQNDMGLWELKVKGSPYERGIAMGKLTEDLVYYQEKVFVDQIKEMIPSESYLKFLRFFLMIYNRNLGKHVPQEYREEIYGIAQSCTHEYDFIGTPYERQLNYHAAHDIGHALQDLMLVGCSSFAVWDSKSADSTLIVGRNFDFYMGDEFARNKIILFVEPDEGYKFASVTWPAMIGVLSGMNEKGLTVTINAAKSAIPTGSATPISILVREILQYASTIDEAYEIAKRRKIFVSESILVSSAIDDRATIIEKSPKQIDIYNSDNQQIICTNHFQSATFEQDERNVENIATTDSYYRYQRLEELLAENEQIGITESAALLRNRYGLQNAELGLSNEMAINQFITHHSVIFKPEQLQMWVSTHPWQSGAYIMYDLNEVFSNDADFSKELYIPSHTIAEDTFLYSEEYINLMDYKRLHKYMKQQIKEENIVVSDSISKFERSNPEYYYMYETLGDYYISQRDTTPAYGYWEKALTKPIGRLSERNRILKKLNLER